MRNTAGKKLQYFDPEINENYVPYVIETSIGLDRMFLAILSSSYVEEELPDGSSRIVLKLPPALAPIKVAVLPLTKKDGLPEIAKGIIDILKFDYQCLYEEKDAIGKRYRRMDAIGTPLCVTVDHQTAEDHTVTLRYRDTMNQERLKIGELNSKLRELVSLESLLKN